MKTRRRIALGVLVALGATAAGLAQTWPRWFEVRVRAVEPGRIYRGAWQKTGPLLRLLAREKVRTVVTLTAINRDDPKYVEQSAALAEAGVNWIIVPMRGSTASLDQMAEAADLVADPALQPVFFHCVGGHHRSNLVQAAYRVRHQGWTADRAWDELKSLSWTRPSAPADRSDRARIEAFAARVANGSRR